MSQHDDTPDAAPDGVVAPEAGNVVSFRQSTMPRVAGKMVLAFRVNKPGCDHFSHLVVNVDDRSIECDNCGAQIDAWDVVLSWATKSLAVCRSVGFYERKRTELTQECVELDKRKKSLQASIRRLEMKLAVRKGGQS